MKRLTLKSATNDELQAEVKRLRKKLRQWQRLHDWESMAGHYHENVARVNLGGRPTVPKYE